MEKTRDRRQLAAIAFTAILMLLVVACYFEFPRYRNTNSGMDPTLRMGDVVIARRGKTVSRGDLIAFRYPRQPKDTFIKRVVAIPGDEIEIRDKRVLLNGRLIEEPYVQHGDSVTYPRQPALPEPYRSRDQFGPARVPPDKYFVLGDNRDQSSDSRYWGFVPKNLIVGRLFLVISPRNGIRAP